MTEAIFNIIFIYFIFGSVGSVLLCAGFSLVSSNGLLFVVVLGLLRQWPPVLWSPGSGAQAQ